MSKKIEISVIIPTYNRAKMLGITIESFVNQKYPKDQYEIIIADNNSSDNTIEVVKDWQKRSPVDIKYIFEQRQGVHYARNTAAKCAKFDLFYFTDDDMIADKELLTEIIKPFLWFENNDKIKIGCAGGKVLPKWEITPPRWVMKYFNNSWLSLLDYMSRFAIGDNVPVYSCHQAIPRDVFFECDGFNPENTAGKWIGDGENGLCRKMLDKGYTFAYNNTSIIYHMIPPTRMTQKYFNLRMANQGSANSYTEYKKYIFSNDKLTKAINKFRIRRMIYFCLFALLRLCFIDLWHVELARVHHYTAKIKYYKKLIQDQNWREMVLKDNWLEE